MSQQPPATGSNPAAVIAPDLAELAAPTDTLLLLAGNPRRGDVDAVARSLATFGQRKPIVARRSDRTVIAGNHTLLAARQLGWPAIAVVWVDDDDVTARAYALADSRTSDLAATTRVIWRRWWAGWPSGTRSCWRRRRGRWRPWRRSWPPSTSATTIPGRPCQARTMCRRRRLRRAPPVICGCWGSIGCCAATPPGSPTWSG
ncbi:MAG: ParB N-terminal domain-containing protein [Acidimicrobiales bacterium]|nr:ParB N-terminal domain-containing protein [Acidimicrobiales bacterium]